MRQLITAFFLCFCTVFSTAQNSKTKIWIDTDILTGKFKKDVDDALTLIMAMRDTNVQIEGISCVQNVDYSEKIVLKLLKWYSPEAEIPTYKGADGKEEINRDTEAYYALASQLEREPIHILALGPITNIAALVTKRPDLQDKILSITFCAGRRPGMLFNPGSGKIKFSDYNFDLDPQSAEIVLKTKIPILLAGYDCSDSLYLAREDFIHLKKSTSPGDRWMYKQMKSWESLWRNFMGSKTGFIPFDCSTYGAFVYANEFDIEPAVNCYVEVAANDSKNQIKSETKPYLFVSEQYTGRPVSYCSFTKGVFKDRLLRAIHHPEYR